MAKVGLGQIPGLGIGQLDGELLGDGDGLIALGIKKIESLQRLESAFHAEMIQQGDEVDKVARRVSPHDQISLDPENLLRRRDTQSPDNSRLERF